MVRVRLSVIVRVSIRTNWVVNFALFRCYWPVIYTHPFNSMHFGHPFRRIRHCLLWITDTLVPRLQDPRLFSSDVMSLNYLD